MIEAGEQNGYFWPAEDYHQKHRLRRNKQLVSLAEVDFGPRWDEHLYFTKPVAHLGESHFQSINISSQVFVV